MQTVALIDYGSGNLRSAAKALERAAVDCGAERRVVVTSSAAEVRNADRIVLPGVGAFADCKRGLESVPDMMAALSETVLEKGRPFLGICVGMQLLAERSREFGVSEGLGWIPGEVVKLEVSDPGLKIPHMGWNDLELARPHPLMAGLEAGAHAYFVHSYHMSVSNPDHVIARTSFGGPVTAMIGRDNIAGTQFHPEKSQATGLTVIGNFLTWTP